jgi:HAMP domain-containing protein
MSHNRTTNRLIVSILLIALVCASVALFLARSEPTGSVTVARLLLPPMERLWSPYSVYERGALIRYGQIRLAGLEVETFFYGVLGICGILLALRAVVLAAQIYKQERLLRMQRRAPNHPEHAPSTPTVKDREWRSAAHPAYTRPQPASGAKKSTTLRWWRYSKAPIPRGLSARVAPYRHSLTGRMITSFTAIVAAFGLLTVAIVHVALTASLRNNAIQRAKVTAANVSDISAVYLAKKNAKGLRELLAKHANRPETAYILVQNPAGEILGPGFATLPQEVRKMPAVRDAASEGQRLLRIGDGDVFEVTMPIASGRLGTVRIGIWRDEINAEINRSTMPLVKILLLVVGGGILVAFYVAWRINRPIVRLVKAAQRISTGDLEAPSLGVEDNSEFGELSRALERMRSSIKAAMARMGDHR